ncbi:hypothetical protein BK764_26010 [Bacillus thuringiensis serovar israelensis]|nr:hypothetical protein ATN07_18355 [Bacillus thuringiensis serovar israelensis]EAO52497.1 hypothetical protein RBTH_01661 [Bacillus thuringiensis serovar israelensis ATCC 35646]KQB18593.1 hypothetical protein AL712_07710 [Bacillus thuringiensis]OTX57855.1 hypothetical protein BK719_33075 [Bacillus thuringiensis serovar novosibirsk]OTZ52187.1 hypothetical protein BK764_26010 [Bacillus thuringiensis serovar israelensis]
MFSHKDSSRLLFQKNNRLSTRNGYVFQDYTFQTFIMIQMIKIQNGITNNNPQKQPLINLMMNTSFIGPTYL